MYKCTVCSGKYTVKAKNVDVIQVIHENGEMIDITICLCSNCEAIQIPVAMNEISYISK